MPKFDSLGDRMKWYEEYFGSNLKYSMPFNPVIIRLDGKAFHTFTKGLNRPFDFGLMNLMDQTTKYLVEETGAIVGYTQSDEITLVLHNENYESQIYFDGKIDKINSLLSAKCSNFFVANIPNWIPSKAGHYPVFDCRTFCVPDKGEAVNAVLWREQDAIRNSVQMLGQATFGRSGALHGKSCEQIKEMLEAHPTAQMWEELSPREQKGAYFQKKELSIPFTAEELEKLPERHAARMNPDLEIKRKVVKQMEWPVLSTVSNREDVFFEGADPICDHP